MKKYTGIVKVYSRLGKYKADLIWIVVLLFLSGLQATMPAQIIGLSIDLISGYEVEAGYKEFIYSNISDNAYILLGIFVAATFLYLLMDVIYAYKVTKIANLFTRDLRKRSVDIALERYMPDRSSMNLGDLISRITKETDAAIKAVSIPLNGLLRNFIHMAWILVIFLIWDYKLAILTVIISAPIYFVARAIGDRSEKCSKETSEINSTLTQNIINVLGNIRFIHVNKTHKKESRNAEGMINEISNKGLEQNRILSKLFPLVHVIKSIAIAVVLLLTYSLIQNDSFSAGDAVIVFLYLEKFFNPILGIQYSLKNLRNAEASLKRVFALEEMGFGYTNKTGGDILGEAPEIVMENVSCSIGEKKIIDDLSCTFKRNSINIVSGDSGRGKSTLIDLLLGLVDISSGSIFFDGDSYEDVVHNPLNISVSFQEHNLFNRPIKENIAYSSEFDEDKARNLLNEMGLEEMIKKHGFDHVISDKATNISGGERKRLSVIRAVYKDSPVYVFDEPSAELDAKNRDRLKSILLHLKQDSTIIIATHDKALMDIGDNHICI